jgi:hypothetical protein
MAADEDDCVSYACECVRLAGLTDDDVSCFYKQFPCPQAIPTSIKIIAHEIG